MSISVRLNSVIDHPIALKTRMVEKEEWTNIISLVNSIVSTDLDKEVFYSEEDSLESGGKTGDL